MASKYFTLETATSHLAPYSVKQALRYFDFSKFQIETDPKDEIPKNFPIFFRKQQLLD